MTELHGGGIPRRRKRKEIELLLVKQPLDLKTYLENLYTRLYEPKTLLPAVVIEEVREAVQADASSLELPPPDDIDFGDIHAKMKAIETLLWALEHQRLAEIDEEEAEFMLLHS